MYVAKVQLVVKSSFNYNQQTKHGYSYLRIAILLRNMQSVYSQFVAYGDHVASYAIVIMQLHLILHQMQVDSYKFTHHAHCIQYETMEY